MSKKGKIYLMIGIVVAMIQILWIVPEMKLAILSAWRIVLYILLVAIGLFIPIFSGIKMINWFEYDEWYIRIGVAVPSSVLVAGINAGLAHLLFMFTAPALLETVEAVSVVAWVTFAVYIITYLIAWYVENN